MHRPASASIPMPPCSSGWCARSRAENPARNIAGSIGFRSLEELHRVLERLVDPPDQGNADEAPSQHQIEGGGAIVVGVGHVHLPLGPRASDGRTDGFLLRLHV